MPLPRRLVSIARLALLFSVPLLVSSPALAQSVGVRAGASVDPDQFFFGGHYETRPLADHVTFRPNLEFGVGNGLDLIALNFELAYKFPSSKPWLVYAGAGPALNIFRVETGPDRVNSEGGFNLLVGIEHRQGLFGEIKAGAMDSPNFKITIGYTFHGL
jgi:hypothetical protein